jgi:hypothetical protein
MPEKDAKENAMSVRRIGAKLFRLIAGAGSTMVSAYGAYLYMGMDLRRDTVAAVIYCLVPMLSLPFFLLSLWRYRSALILHAAAVMIFFAAYSILDWRTCAEHGYCSSAAATVWETITSRVSRAVLGVLLANFLALILSSRRQSSQAAD